MAEIILEAQGLVKVFETGGKTVRVLDGVSLTLSKGESLAITGPSGSGKSTLLALLAGLERPTQGRVFFQGADLNALSENQLSALWGRKIGFVFQSYYLLPALTALENVRTPLDIAGAHGAEKKAEEWLAKVGLSHRAGHLPSQLSGGEQQRVALARAMVSGPEILFADEPTGNLDTRTGKEMEEILFSLVREHGSALVLVTHEADFAKRADRGLKL
ncbi:MAG: ABC transporter [Elusimicrobia bacterium RIFCSPLOWO2_01_FULL_54_10]|nr:MAG: ABC transporter [Elusimicrobia bacterium RIFCSPLOWO2_01_FULL_54_10]